MDLARAIYKIVPTAEYRLNHSQADDRQEIIEWRGPGLAPPAAALRDAWDLCLDDDLAALLKEQERQKAILRLKGDAAFSDVVKVLDL